MCVYETYIIYIIYNYSVPYNYIQYYFTQILYSASLVISYFARKGSRRSRFFFAAYIYERDIIRFDRGKRYTLKRAKGEQKILCRIVSDEILYTKWIYFPMELAIVKETVYRILCN